jgi:RNAse (barnase) inhibitor barstar
VEDKTALMEALGTALQAPDHFGRNLDALHDVLRDLGGRLLLLWDEWGPFARADRDTFEAVTGILAQRSGQGDLAVLLRGEGPETDLPSLD